MLGGVELGAIMLCCCDWLALRDAELTPTTPLLLPFIIIKLLLPVFALQEEAEDTGDRWCDL